MADIALKWDKKEVDDRSVGGGTGTPFVEAPLQGNGEGVLIVDDGLAVQSTQRFLLERYHYRILVATDGIEAIALYVKHQAEIQVVLLDVMMPNMDGIGAIRVLRTMNPAIKIIAISGLATEMPFVGWQRILIADKRMNKLISVSSGSHPLPTRIHCCSYPCRVNDRLRNSP
jgi:CheY-like chemotaxis protein